MNHTLEDVTPHPELWSDSDPVRPELGPDFKTAPGRGVYGLRGDDGAWKAFLCYARTTCVPSSVADLEEHTNPTGNIMIPYTVWSLEKGAGKEIINQVISMAKKLGDVARVVTLSPLTNMARRFHLKNNAVELRMNETTVNFEYKV